MDEKESWALYDKIHETFLPGTAISTLDLFAGRKEQMTDVLSAIKQPGRHVILFGERGVGKTSLAKVLVDLERGAGFHTLENATVNCDESDDFSSLWHKVFCALPYTEQNGKTIYLDELLNEEVSPDNVRFALSQYQKPSLIVLDEVDQLKDSDAKSLLTATIKNLSDHAVNTTLIIVGVADTVNELIVVQKSAERALEQVRMPRMSSKEIYEIIDKGFTSLGMTIEAGARDMIARLSQRLPYYTHSLCLYSGLAAINVKSYGVTIGDVAGATVKVVYKAHNVRSAYHTATSSPQPKSLYAKALLACALTETDELGFFPAAEVGKWMSVLMGKDYEVANYIHYLKDFCTAKRGRVLQSIGEKRRIRYRFSDPMMQPFVIITAVGKGEVTLETLRPAEVQDYAQDYSDYTEEGFPPF